MNQIRIIHAKVLTMVREPIENGYVTLADGKITTIGTMETIPQDGCETLDAAGGWLLPGLIDAHSHIGLYEDSLGFEGEDGNEDTDPITPQLRVIDGINPMDRSFVEARAAGVTTVVVSPGSANPIGGQMAAIKTCGRRIDDMIVRAPAAMKFALGENPKSVYHDKEQTPVTRMATASLIREQLMKAREYGMHQKEAALDEDKEPRDYDDQLEALLPVLSGEIAAHFHAHRADDIFTALRIAKEFSLRPVIVHGTEAHLVADLLAPENVPIISGPFMTDRSKPELTNLTERAPALLRQVGVPVAITTDHPEFPVKYLFDAARFAVRGGMETDDALRAITIDAARIADIADRVGSIESGKDGDLVLLTGDPFDYSTRVVAVFCDGKQVEGTK